MIKLRTGLLAVGALAVLIVAYAAVYFTVFRLAELRR
jgi:hypothetical protein